jgi:hypothetical protein
VGRWRLWSRVSDDAWRCSQIFKSHFNLAFLFSLQLPTSVLARTENSRRTLQKPHCRLDASASTFSRAWIIWRHSPGAIAGAEAPFFLTACSALDHWLLNNLHLPRKIPLRNLIPVPVHIYFQLCSKTSSRCTGVCLI